jgi:hypothetical protein
VLASPDIPTVLGAGPSGSGVALPGGLQRDSAYYRVHTVVMPPTARLFVQPGSTLEMELPGDLLPFTGFAPGASELQIAKFSGRVALDGACFSDPTLLDPTSTSSNRCIWLGSEAALQTNLDLSTEETTTITVTWEVTDLLTPNADGSVTAVPGPVAPPEPL